jgi:G:T/U-mismatch repair DNA glycosylase
MVTRYKKKLDEYNEGHPKSRKDFWRVLNTLGDREARLQFQLLHPDHIQYASIVFKDVAETFYEIARAKRTNIQKILEARGVVYMANRDLENFARDDILYVRGLPNLDHYRR